MWTPAQTSHAENPEKRTNPRSARAEVRPMIANSPLSHYQKGFGGGWPLTRFRMTLATY